MCLCGSSSAVHIAASCAAGGRGLMTQLSAQVFWTWLLCVICFVGVLTGCLCAGKLWISCSHFFLLTSLSAPWISWCTSFFPVPTFPFLLSILSECACCHGACGRSGHCGVVLTQLPGLLSSCTGMSKHGHSLRCHSCKHTTSCQGLICACVTMFLRIENT